MSTIKTTSQPIGQQSVLTAPHRSWFARHKILTVLGVLLVLVFVGGYIWGWPLVKWRFHRLFVNSLTEIQRNPAAAAKLGEPISVPMLPLPSGNVNTDDNRGDALFYFSVVGSKDKAEVVSRLRMLEGKWGYTQLKLTFPDNTSLDLSQGIQQRDGDEMPKFDPNAKQIEVKPPDLNVDISIPSDLPAEPKK